MSYQIDTTYYENLPEEIELLPRNNYSYTAICSSEACVTKGIETGTNINIQGAVKNVRKGLDVCPDCGYYLFWERK
jgi:hypothetical protein